MDKKTQRTAADAMMEHVARMQVAMDAIQTAIEIYHDMVAPGDVTWGNVADAAHMADLLEEAAAWWNA